MSNLDKFKEAARKLEQKGQWQKAIEQLVKAIDAFEATPEGDDAELALYNKVGDLYQKVGDTQNAITYYERAVDKYAEGGLVNNAIALANKMLRLAPGRAPVYLKLGMLFAKKGFGTEAKQNLLEYADRMQKAGQLEEAFKALKKFAEMTPGNDDMWAVLAQQARAAAKTPEAAEQVEKLLAEFEAKDKVVVQRRSRMSRSMITGEDLPPEPKAKKDLVFLDLGEPTPAARRSAATRAPVEELPPPEPEIPALEIESTSLATPEEVSPAAEVPLLEVEPTSLAEPEAAPAAASEPSFELEPTTLDVEPTSLVEPAAAAPADDLGALDLEVTPIAEEQEERAEAVAGLPLLEVGEEEPAAVAEAQSSSTLEFLDLGEVTATAPSIEDLGARIFANAEDWEAHRLFGEALIEKGERERGLAELDLALDGYDQAGDLEMAYVVTEEVLRLDPNSVRHQQKRVEIAYRQSDKARLVDAYVELADALLRSNDPDKAIAVYQRVLEHDPSNPRARSALDTLAPPAAAPAAPAAAAPSAPPTPLEPAAVGAAAGEYVDLAALLFDEEGPKDTRMRIEDEEPTGDEQKDFSQMLAAFKKGIEANVGEEDFQSHYDLGVAYKEMGLLDEAIAEFQKALRSTDGRLKSSEALGLCFFEKGQFAVAETILRRALELPASSEAERIGLLYWLGRTLEEQGKGRDALGSYNRVFAVDINFQDVNQRVKALSKAGV
ncbi:MAG: tetratricopeptide repeat protein [Gemmatimonadetes bacterium]|nr:tetratricopeptide repeat protein [Gemmatimonadota bacterium]